MKYKILEVGEDANKNITVAVEYSNDSEKEEKTFNFDPTETKENILEAVSKGCPISEKTEEEITKETACDERQAELAGEVNKETEIVKLK